MKFKSFGITDVGRKRAHNEDSICVNDELGLYIAADGMGGHNAGEVASSTAVDTVLKFVRRCAEDKDFTWPFGVDANLSEEANILLTAVRIANRNVCLRSGERYEYSGMGTTIVCLYLENGEIAHLAHVGDSRCYVIREDEMKQLTLDHSWVSEQIQKNMLTEEDARNHRWKNVITRALGNKLNVEIDMNSERILPGDCFLLCSDGLSGMLSDGEILKIVQDADGSVEKACKELVRQANEAGGLDNISVILIQREK